MGKKKCHGSLNPHYRSPYIKFRARGTLNEMGVEGGYRFAIALRDHFIPESEYERPTQSITESGEKLWICPTCPHMALGSL